MTRYLCCAALLAALLAGLAAPPRAAAQPAGYTCDGSAGVYLYTGLNQTGRCLRLTVSVADLGAFGFDEAISSLRMDGVWTVALYADPNFGGTEAVFSADDPNVIDDVGQDNWASSARIWPGRVPADKLCDGRAGVYLYAAADYGGRCLRFDAAAPDLAAFGFDNAAASIGFVGEWVATLYADPGFGGNAATFVANSRDLADAGVGRGRASSLTVRRGQTAPAQPCDGSPGVYLYRSPDFQGECQRFTGDVPDLRSYAFDDAAGSLRLRGGWQVRLYRDPDYRGASAIFIDDAPDLATSAVGDSQVTSLQIRQAPTPPGFACDGGPGVYLYQNPQYSGRCLKFTADAPDLRDFGFDDLASSAKVFGGYTATLYRDPGLAGVSSNVTDDVLNLAYDPLGDDQASSLAVRRAAAAPAGPTCDGSAGVYLYAEANYGGRCLRLSADAPDLRDFGFDDLTSSVRVVGDYAATLYRDLSFSGAATPIAGDNAALDDDPVGENQATSVQVHPSGLPAELVCAGAGVYIYQDPQFQGPCRKFINDVPDLRIYDFDDRASSLRVVGPYSVRLYADLAFRGRFSGYTSADPNLADDAIGDNQTTSLRIERR